MIDRANAPEGSWLELSVDVDSEAVEAVSELMSRHAYGQGVAVYEQYRQDPDGDNLSPDPSLPVRVVAYLPSGDESEHQILQIEEGLWHLRHLGNIGALVREERPEEDWANAWKDHFHVLRIGDRFVIRPTWREYDAAPGDLVIDLDPGMAFGTGHHPTTELCLRWLEEIPVAGKSVLDVGAGSGILSIACVLLDADSVRAVEVDEIAARALQENLEMNHVAERVTVSVADFGASEQVNRSYDLVVANIISSILTKLAAPLVASVGPDGKLLLSGVIERHLDQVRGTFTGHGMKVLEERKQGDWIAMLLERDG